MDLRFMFLDKQHIHQFIFFCNLGGIFSVHGSAIYAYPKQGLYTIVKDNSESLGCFKRKFKIVERRLDSG